ncbi:hypothetical protein E2R51_16880 [Jeotgalibacillus sp. S-D1]|uniref:hypothetical protein n=1 Tax=Jeotgalibacillus sp. S-D1 TaxID=2552189 RepID=UPI00105A82AD|nr:hypothetical protein [Jeotgalibacillus sp. S-D1]TDL30665.1 hypothetical protein E2R51_16880 [Jeotgalibacillus sp. S-D1]
MSKGLLLLYCVTQAGTGWCIYFIDQCNQFIDHFCAFIAHLSQDIDHLWLFIGPGGVWQAFYQSSFLLYRSSSTLYRTSNHFYRSGHVRSAYAS